MPKSSIGMTCSSSIATSQRTGRTNFAALAPVHVLRPVERRDFLGQSFGQNLGGGTPFAGDGGGQVLAFRSAHLSSRLDLHSDLFGEGVRCGSGLAILVGNLRRRSRHLLGDVGLRGSHPGPSPQAARGGQGGNPGLSQMLAFQQLSHPISQFACAPSIIRAGISSQPISSRKSGIQRTPILPEIGDRM